MRQPIGVVPPRCWVRSRRRVTDGGGAAYFDQFYHGETVDSLVGTQLAERLLGYRVFPDSDGRMNLSVRDVGGGLLLVPQFTLTADTKKGTRASFTRGAPPEKASDYFDRLISACRQQLDTVESGVFGADMQVSLTNDGPVTFWLSTRS